MLPEFLTRISLSRKHGNWKNGTKVQRAQVDQGRSRQQAGKLLQNGARSADDCKVTAVEAAVLLRSLVSRCVLETPNFRTLDVLLERLKCSFLVVGST